MGSDLCRRLGVDFPIFGFSHCRNVVATLSKAGGMGVLGTTRLSPEQLEIELSRLDEEIGGKPYGVDLVFPAELESEDIDELAAQLPAEHRKFVMDLIERFGIPKPTHKMRLTDDVENRIMTHSKARERLEVVLRHPARLLVSALGPPPPDVVVRAHEKGMLVAGMVGTPRQAKKQVTAGADVVIAVGLEAGGHTSETSTMVLVPQVVDAVAPVPVLAGGGIASGRQVAAGIALGADGAWAGSVWLTTSESDVPPQAKEMLLAASSLDTVVTKCQTGKPVRQLTTPWVMAWEARGAPRPLGSPTQAILVRDAVEGMVESEMHELLGYPVGQVVGMMNSSRSTREVVRSMVEEYAQVLVRLESVVD